MKTTKLNNYQACYYLADTDTKTREIAVTAPIQAKSLVDAYEAAESKPGYECLVYPLATLDGGEGIQDLADYVVKQFHKWERRNNNAVLASLNRSTWDVEDEHADAALAIVEGLTAYQGITMYDLYKLAFNRLSSQRDKLFRKSECEYNPNVLFCNMVERRVRETYPELCELFRWAQEELSDMPKTQWNVVEQFKDGISVQHISDNLGANRKNTYKSLYKALYKILVKAVELDPNLTIFAKAGLSREDVEIALVTFKKRAVTK